MDFSGYSADRLVALASDRRQLAQLDQSDMVNLVKALVRKLRIDYGHH